MSSSSLTCLVVLKHTPEHAVAGLKAQAWTEQCGTFLHLDLTPPFVPLETQPHAVLAARIKARSQKSVLLKSGVTLLNIST